jgi:hypothetical protein
MENYLEIENRILSNVKSQLEKINYKFNLSDITYNVIIKRDKGILNDDYMSEMEIVFYLKGEVFDIIEFSIYREGKLYLDETILEKSLLSEFEKLIESIK